MKCDVRIMASPKRRAYVKGMLRQLGVDESIVTYDDRPQGGGAMYTARKTWLFPFGSGVTHRCVLQDDLEVAPGFLEAIGRIVGAYPEAIFTLFCPKIDLARLEARGPYCRIDGHGVWGQAVIIPKEHIAPLFAWIDRINPAFPHDDTAIGQYAELHDIPVMTTIPGLVQHCCPTESLLGFNNRKKVSKVYTGADASVIDWGRVEAPPSIHNKSFSSASIHTWKPRKEGDMSEQYNTTPEETQDAIVKRGIRKGKKAVEKKLQSLSALTIEYVPIGSIKPNDYNPNRQSEHDFELLCRSMMEDGFTQPIIVIKENREIVDGEHRWRAAQSIGHTEIPVVFVDMTPEQARISTLRHNRARGTEDFNLSAAVLRDLQELGAIDWAQDSLMLTDAELTRMLEDTHATDLASEEYSEAWEPDKAMLGVEEIDGVQDGDVLRAGTASAVKDVRERERQLREAKTQEERASIRKDMAIFRISLIFNGEEAEIVKQGLGPRPAERLVELCRGALNGVAIGAVANKSRK